jgi:Carboxypeptidase regulatory-like domain
MRFKDCKRLPCLKRRRRSKLVFLCLLISQALTPLGASTGGFISGIVRDRSGAVIPDVEVRVQNECTGAQHKLTSDVKGAFVSAELAPGQYRVILRRRGFRTASYPDLTVQAGQVHSGEFVIDLLPLQQEVTVESSRDTTDPATNGLAVSRHSTENVFPANGRDLHAYFAIIPGGTLTPASTSDGGQFSVSGQRPNTNTVRVDGINANTGVGVSALPGTYPGSSLPAMTAIGSTQSIASKEEIERTEFRSSDFSPESGERPGAEILIETRSGSNDFHGSAFGLLRPSALDSEDWFAQRYDVPLQASSLNGYGGNLGGPLIPNRTFFFAAFEKDAVTDTAMQLMATPSLQARARANPSVAILLNAFPTPIGPTLGPDTALGAAPLQQHASVENYSVRMDQILWDKARLFVRYSNVPSRSFTEHLGNIDAGLRSISATLGLTAGSSGAIHDFRFNFSRTVDTSSWAAGSSAEQAAFNAFPAAPGTDVGTVGGNQLALLQFAPYGRIDAISIAGVGQLVSGIAERTYQNQWEGAYTFAKQSGRHEFRFGADFICLIPDTQIGSFAGLESAASAGVAPLLAGVPLGFTVSDGKASITSGKIPIGSVFAQDTLHLKDLSIMFGLRWEITPPSIHIRSEDFLSEVATWAGPGTPQNTVGYGAPLNRSSWPMSYAQIAPRIGLAYRLRRPALTFRAGAGIFYETALGSLIYPVNLSLLNTWQFVPATGTASPLASSYIQPSPPPPLSLPRIWEWRASAERSIGEHSALSVAYAGSVGSHLLRLEGTLDQSTGVLQQTYFTSYGTSDYQALQAQFRGNVAPNLYALVSYTWGHSIDNGSQASTVYLAPPGYSPSLDRASSDFDIRHNVNASLSYRLAPSSIGRWQSWLNDWIVSTTAAARTGFPFNVTTVDRSIGLGFANTGRPNLVPGQPIWIGNNSVPGGQELNAKAFEASAGLNGNLGRNILRGPGLFQIDASLRRQFRLFGRSSLGTSVTAFNLLNHASFANPVGYLGSPLFGQPVSMQNLMMGSGNPTNGLAPVFQPGGPRTVEAGIKISF